MKNTPTDSFFAFFVSSCILIFIQSVFAYMVYSWFLVPFGLPGFKNFFHMISIVLLWNIITIPFQKTIEYSADQLAFKNFICSFYCFACCLPVVLIKLFS